MATWKKVLVSGSDISVGQITSSNIPDAPQGNTDDVLVVTSDGLVKKVTQGSIQGTTTANFAISGSTGNDIFNATADTLKFAGTNGATADVTSTTGQTTVTVNLPDDTVSGSSQINIASTVGYSDFSSSLATDIATNASNISLNDTDIATIQADIVELEATASELKTVSGTLATGINDNATEIGKLQTSVTALNSFSSSVVTNDDTGSFIISSSIEGTTNEIDVTSTAAGNITIGLPDNVTIGGRLEAGKLVIQGQNITDVADSIISGSTIQGNSVDDVHQFTGSLHITGGLTVDATGKHIFFDGLSTDSSATVDDIIVRTNGTGQLGLIGNAVKAGISGAFDSVSSSIALDIANINTSAITTNSTDITALKTISSSLLNSASSGIRFEDEDSNGESIGLTQTASFQAAGDGLSVAINNGGVGTTGITYTVNPTAIASAVGAYSESAQLQVDLDSIYVNYTEGPITGAQQLQDMGFITSSDFDQLTGVPSGLISGAQASSTQGNIKLNNNEVVISGLSTTDSPTFKDVTITNNLTVYGNTVALETDNLNVEDQFLLINSGAQGGDQANELNGGLIVDSGNGSGSLFMFHNSAKAWGFKGATDPANGPAASGISNTNIPVNPDVYVGTVKASGIGGGVAPTSAPDYGTSDYQKGSMFINTDDNTIWVYA